MISQETINFIQVSKGLLKNKNTPEEGQDRDLRKNKTCPSMNFNKSVVIKMVILLQALMKDQNGKFRTKSGHIELYL